MYRAGDVPQDRRGAFQVPPLAIVETLSDNAHHDVVRKDEIYAQAGARRAYLDPDERFGWWLRLDDVDDHGPVAEWRLDGWPALRFDRAERLAD